MQVNKLLQMFEKVVTTMKSVDSTQITSFNSESWQFFSHEEPCDPAVMKKINQYIVDAIYAHSDNIMHSARAALQSDKRTVDAFADIAKPMTVSDSTSPGVHPSETT